MLFLYATDLHGDVQKYNSIIAYAKKEGIKTIHLGADLMPKPRDGDIFKCQKKFIQGFLKGFFKDCDEHRIKVLCHFGNDDIYTMKPYFKEYGSLLDETPEVIDSYVFKAYGFVPDNPFGLKTACKIDHKGWKLKQPYITIPVETTDNKFIHIEGLTKYFEEKGTIEDDLLKIKEEDNLIMSIHCPPWGLDLDVIYNGHRVGSKAVYDWIERTQPLLVLSGHIHESPCISGVWRRKLNNTTVIQPGQRDFETTAVLIELNKNEDPTFYFIRGC